MNFTMDSTTISFAILLVTILVLIGLIIHLNSKLKKFLVGTKAENLNHSIEAMDNSIKSLETFKTEMENYLVTVENRLKKSVQAVETVRFNPFKGTTGSGGNQSFATAFLNEKGDGVVISSLYARDHVSLFAKPVKGGTSEYELSDEEKQAVSEAIKIVK